MCHVSYWYGAPKVKPTGYVVCTLFYKLRSERGVTVQQYEREAAKLGYAHHSIMRAIFGQHYVMSEEIIAWDFDGKPLTSTWCRFNGTWSKREELRMAYEEMWDAAELDAGPYSCITRLKECSCCGYMFSDTIKRANLKTNLNQFKNDTEFGTCRRPKCVRAARAFYKMGKTKRPWPDNRYTLDLLKETIKFSGKNPFCAYLRNGTKSLRGIKHGSNSKNV